MSDVKLVIIGGGLAGLSAGCYARASGFDVTIVEHNLALGGVCTAWHRGPYLVDGCIHWLAGGPFLRLSILHRQARLPSEGSRPEMNDGRSTVKSNECDASVVGQNRCASMASHVL